MTTASPELVRVARALGEPSRVRMLSLLMGGRALTAKELAHGAEIDPATATGHLRRLLESGLVDVAAQGRHRYFRLRGAEVAALLEQMMVVSASDGAAPATPGQPIRIARFCYDHLAGRLGTALTAALAARSLIVPEGGSFAVTADGEAWFRGLGVEVEPLRHTRRAFARACLDWTERTDHLAGALGAALAARMLETGWIERVRRSRVVNVTPLGRRELKARLDVVVEDPA
ncbi:MAG: winged helix-turn-helix transcriptional regulator [Gemmatimonadetes bacterium]|nr:winged helix-turn-helix transcriptional regulator [Gemmatimonadota bacterium]